MPKKRSHTVMGGDASSDSDEEEKFDIGAWAELVSGDRSFKPLYLLSSWEEPGVKTKAHY